MSTLMLLASLLQTSLATRPTTVPTTPPAAFIVAKDGSGTHRQLQDAIDASARVASEEPCSIVIQPGVYAERIHIARRKGRLRLIGANPDTTLITGNLNANTLGPDGQPLGTARTPTARIDADEFACENVTFENSAAPRSGQAIAIQVDGDRLSFRNCRFLGYQDTIYGNRGRHYFEGCTVVGAVDFIFGGATEYYENCTIRCIANGYITAASTPEDQRYGFVFDHCHITGASGVQMFLGRPWRPYAATAYLHCDLDAVIRPLGWDHWGPEVDCEKTARYVEYRNIGTGAASENRAAWAGQLSDGDAAKYEKLRVLGGWRP